VEIRKYRPIHMHDNTINSHRGFEMFSFVAVLQSNTTYSNQEKCISSWETTRLKANFCTLPSESRNIQYSLESKIECVSVNEESKNKVKCNQPK
jgi:hypothetical protein